MLRKSIAGSILIFASSIVAIAQTPGRKPPVSGEKSKQTSVQEDLLKSFEEQYVAEQTMMKELAERPDDPAPVVKAALVRRAALEREMAFLHRVTNATEQWIAGQQDVRWRTPDVISLDAFKDGGWSFSCPKGFEPRCDDPGVDPCRVRATSLATLALMARGSRPKRGRCFREVENGFDFLASSAKVQGKSADLRGPEGDMTSHAMAALVFGELYNMDRDPAAKAVFLGAIGFLKESQSPGGGWGAEPGKAADMRTTVWCALALKSARWGKIPIDDEMKRGVEAFLDRTQAQDGPGYGLTDRGRDPQATAMGVVCREIVRGEERPPRQRENVDMLLTAGYAKDDVIFNFFATLGIAYAADAPANSKWSDALRSEMKESMVSEGKPGYGSFYNSKDPSAKAGGRLYQTAMNALAGSVYYRHLPLFARGH